MNLQTRIEKLEQRTRVNVSDVNLELFDVNGQKVVDAKILRLPMDWECGLAILPDGTEIEIEIACEGNWRDIIFESERLLNSDIQKRQEEQEAQEHCLFLRKNGQKTAVEIICHKQIGK